MLRYKRQGENKMRAHSLQKLKLKRRVSRTIRVVKDIKTVQNMLLKTKI